MRASMLSGRGIVTAVLAAGLMVAGSCSSDDEVSTGDVTTTAVDAPETTVADDVAETSVAPDESEETLRIFVTNDDGIGALGIDMVVEGLRNLPNTEVTVIAPLENQSGSGGKTTEGQLTVAEATTLSGFAGTSVMGFPADTVIYALDQGGLAEAPHLVVSGINEGPNLGPIVEASGTIGAARAAVQRGIPALAASQGSVSEPDYASGTKYVLEWVEAHRAELLSGDYFALTPPAERTVASFNIPSCATGEIRGLVEVPTATDAQDRDFFANDCESSATDPVDDMDAFGAGYVSLSPVSQVAAAG